MTLRTPRNTARDRGINHLDALRRLTLALLLATLLGMSLGSVVSEARQLTVFSCHDPAGNAVGHDGWVNDRSSDAFMVATDSCGPGDQGTLSLELGANWAGYGNGASTEWVFTAPAWASITSYGIHVAGSYGIPSSGGGSGQTFIGASDESDPIYDYRNLGAGSLGPADITRSPPAPASWVRLNASCDGASGACASGSRTSRIDVTSTSVTLNDSTTPTVTGLTGNLISGVPLKGNAEVDFNATDGGPGVYSGALIVDGHAQPAEILNANSGWCQSLGQTSDGSRSFAHADPCPQTVSGSLTLDTTGLADGQHSLRLLVDDASGDATTAYNGTITTDNGQASVSSTPGGGAGTAFAGSAEGAGNGTGASRAAQLHLGGGRTVTRSFAQRALRVGGRLQDGQGQPIANATLDVLQRVADSDRTQLIAQLRTGADGSFASHLRAGPSRTIEVAYRAFSGDSSYAAQATLEESVRAGVALKVLPRRTNPTGIISLSGRVAGPIPRQGVVVELLVHYLGHWEPFRTPRTDSRGRFRVAYQFQGSVGRFPFRAEVLGGQSGFPYGQGASRAVDVATR